MEAEPPSSVLLAGFTLFQPFLFVSSSTMAFSFLLLILLLLLSALISGSEMACFSLSPLDIQTLKDSDDKSSARVLKLKRQPRRLLATILIANNFINIGIVILSAYLVDQVFGDTVFETCAQWLFESITFMALSVETYAKVLNTLVTVIGVTFILVLFGEVIPKIYAKFNNVFVARRMSSTLSALSMVFYPISRFLVGWSARLERALDMSTNTQDHREEIEEAIELTVSGDQHADKEVNILKRIIKFSEVSVKQIMRNRVDIIAESTDSSLGEVLETIRSSGFSRFPVYEESLDQVIGLLYAKDFIGFDVSTPWQKLIRKDVHYVPESKHINELLKEFQQKRMHMAIVVDEFGGVSGLVTLEDVMEEVIGEITDEFDAGDDVEFVKLNDKTFIFEGRSLINDVSRIMDIESVAFDSFKGEADSVAGMMLEVLGQIPRLYQEVTFGNFVFRADQVNKRRIEKVRISAK